MADKKTVVITGGGTGGHIYPGLAIGQEIEKLYPDIRVYFVGAVGGLEEKILPKSNVPYALIPVGRLHRSVGRWQQIKTLLAMPYSLWKALQIFLKLKPVAVLGVGGFASGPFLLMGRLMGARTALWEPNAYPGLTNRWLSRVVDICFVVFSEASEYMKAKRLVTVGLPVRKQFFHLDDEKTLSSLDGKINVLVFGGSQGARAINEVVVRLIQEQPELLKQIHLRHQTGAADYTRIKALYGEHLSQIDLSEYIHDMPSELQQADLVICRSGASTVAEIIACQKPALFIPLPTAADDHQLKNAQVLSRQQAAFVLEQKDLNTTTLGEHLRDFCKNPQKARQMAEKLKAFDFSNAAEKISRTLLEDGPGAPLAATQKEKSL